MRVRRLVPIAVTLSLGAAFIPGIAAAQQAATPAAPPQLPQQVVPTGEEDAPRAPSFGARAAQQDEQALERQLREMTSESAEGLRTIRKDDGTISIDLQGRFMNVMIATPTDDGGYALSCHSGEDALKHAHRAADIMAGKIPKLNTVERPAPTTDASPVLEEK